MLAVKQLSFHYAKANPLLNNINFTLKQGDMLTLLGANGQGKSTLLNCIAGLLSPTSGQILLENSDLQQLTSKQISQKVAYVTQHSPQTYQYSVRDYVVLGRAVHLGLFDKPTEDDFEQVEHVLVTLNIVHLLHKTYMQLSGGEKQLVNLARILIQQPKLILFDEPTSALDYGNIFMTLNLICELSTQGFTIVMTTHNPDHSMLIESRLPDSKVALLDRNGTLQIGSTSTMMTQQNLSQLYHTPLSVVDVATLQRKICTIPHL